MFEKEAEEYAVVDLPDGYTKIDYQKKVDWQKGAEFGYKKGFKDCAKSRLNVTTISDCPIKDDWHYVKDGDLPKEHKCVLLSNIYGHTETGYYFNGQWFGREVIFDDVFAWQELPQPSKEMEQEWEKHKPPKENE